MLGIANFSGAFADVLVSAIIVEAARLDLTNGSHDLQSLSWIMYGVGGLIGTTFAAFVTQYFTPSLVFGFQAIFGLLTCVAGLFINTKDL